MSARAAEYRELIEDVLSGGLLEEDEIMELRDMIKRAERRMQANLPASNQRAMELRNMAEEGLHAEQPDCEREASL